MPTAILAGLAAATSPATASIYTLTLTGNVRNYAPTDGEYANEIDRPGLFGTAGTFLGGKAVTMVFTIDTSQPWLVTPPSPGSYTQVTQAGINPYYQYGDAISATVTIGGRTVSNIGVSSNGASSSGFGSEQQIAIMNYSPTFQTFQILARDSNNYPTTVGSVNGQSFGGLSVSASINFRMSGLAPGSYFPGPFDLAVNPDEPAQFSFTGWQGSTNQSFNAYLAINHAVFAEAAVPEPATWGMMVGGFGLVGGALRRRRGMAIA